MTALTVIVLALALCEFAGVLPLRGSHFVTSPDHDNSTADYPSESLRVLNPEQAPSNCGPLIKRPRPGQVLDLVTVFQHCDYFMNHDNTGPDCLQFLKEKELQSFRNVTATTQDAAAFACTDRQPILIHSFWHGNVTDKVALMIKSFLFTQPLECARLKVWVAEYDPVAVRENEHVQKFVRFMEAGIVEFKNFSFEEQFKLYGENHLVEDLITRQCSRDIFHCSKESFSPSAFYRSFSDLVRLMLLYNFGGIYVDADTILLRDLSPLFFLNEEFSVNWGHEQFRMNTAFLKLFRHSDKGKIMISEGLRMESFHPLKFQEYLRWHGQWLMMLPNVLFDPLWMQYDLKKEAVSWTFHPALRNYEEPWEIRGENFMLNAFFEGAYTFHWHNHWDWPIRSGSWMGMWQNAYDEFLLKNRSNRYGELAEWF
eukprot:TRINITY_DN15123_c0_g1_i4.p1 TRINITY_DN15123_c0_g1~~TRINITY_DN15123_c0_g1_i4.p1  ORF type:complete len:444 (+),score=90.01 TRINITY_DN15123_c0_g1_i4:56-1333(+)